MLDEAEVDPAMLHGGGACLACTVSWDMLVRAGTEYRLKAIVSVVSIAIVPGTYINL